MQRLAGRVGANVCPGRLARSVQCAFSCHFDDHLDECDGGDLKKEFYCRAYEKGFAKCSCDAALHRCKHMSLKAVCILLSF